MLKKRSNKPCPHHWDIERATGAVSKGKCRLCGMVKDFENSTYEGYAKMSLDKHFDPVVFRGKGKS